jgi:sialidase-1
MKFFPRPSLFFAALVAFSATVRPGFAEPCMTLSPETKTHCLQILREALGATAEEEFWFAMHAAEALTVAGYGEEVRRAIEPKLETEKDGQHRCGIARELVRAGDRDKVSILLEELSRPDSYAHTHAAESLYKVFEIGDETFMRERFTKGDNIKLKLMAAAALARETKDESAFAFIREARDGKDMDGIQISAWILGVIGDSQDIEPIRRRIPDVQDPVIGGYLVNALASLGDPEGLKQLTQNLSHEDPVIRTYAATFAADAKACATQPVLESMLNDSFLDARVRAAQALLQLSNETK